MYRARCEVGVCLLQKSIRWNAGECYMGFASAYIHHVPMRLDRHVSIWTHTGHMFNDCWMSVCDGVLWVCVDL